MKMKSNLGCFLEMINKRMSKLTKTNRGEAIKSLDNLNGECNLQVGGKPYKNRFGFDRLEQSSIENPLDIKKIKSIIKTSMNHWNKGYGPVYDSTGKTKEGNKRILIKHKIPGELVGDTLYFPYNNFYEVTEK